MAKCVKYLAKNLNYFFEVRGGSKREFADFLGVSPTYLGQLFKGTNPNPDFGRLEKIAERLNTTVAQLLMNPDASPGVDVVSAAQIARDHLKYLAEKEGYPWPLPIDVLARLLK